MLQNESVPVFLPGAAGLWWVTVAQHVYKKDKIHLLKEIKQKCFINLIQLVILHLHLVSG